MIKSLNGQRCFCVTLKEYLASGNETQKDSHPCYRNPWLFHIQVFKALMGQPPEKEPSVKDREPATVSPEGQSSPALQQAVELTSRAL